MPRRLFHFQQHQRSKNPRIHSQADLQLQLHPEGCVATVHIPVRTKRGRASTCGDSGPWNL